MMSFARPPKGEQGGPPNEGEFVTITFDPQAGHEQIPVESGLTGFVMCEQMKSVDFRARDLKRIASAPKEFLDEVLSVIDACIYPKPEQDQEAK